jgi:hypothetical protein
MKFEGYFCDSCKRNFYAEDGMIEMTVFDVQEFTLCSWECAKKFVDEYHEEQEMFQQEQEIIYQIEGTTELDENENIARDLLLQMLCDKRDDIRKRLDNVTFQLDHKEWTTYSKGALEIMAEEKDRLENELFGVLKEIRDIEEE